MKKKITHLPRKAIKIFQTELEAEIKSGNVRQMAIHDLLMTIISLNMTLFLAEPLFKTITGMSDKDYKSLIERRKKENVDIILKSIKP